MGAPLSQLDETLPPDPSTDVNDPAWHKWFYNLYERTLKDGMLGTKVAVQGKDGTATFSPERMWFRALSLDSGLYVNYTSDNGNIIYGFAAAVRRSGGKSLTVAAQLDAIGGRNAGDAVFAAALEAWGEPGFMFPLVGAEAAIINQSNANVSAKTGLAVIFKDRPDGATTVVDGLGSNFYNYDSAGLVFDAQGNSATGELCGWSRGIQFIGSCLNTQTPRAWSAVATYTAGMVVSSGGVLWQAIVNSINQVPAAGSAYWVQHTTGAVGLTEQAVGIDFSSLPLGTLANISNAIRLRDGMSFAWDAFSAITTFFDFTNSRMVLCDNSGNRQLQVEVGANSAIWLRQAADPVAGGGAATLGPGGINGPVGAAQVAWMNIRLATVNYFIPLWQ
jgi:hypothetical protein